MKDKDVFVIMGATNHGKEKRQKVDFYATHPNTLKIFLDKLKEDNIQLPKNIFEPTIRER